MGKWGHGDTANHSGDSTSQVAAAEHQARDDATAAGVLERGNSEKNSERFSHTDSAGQAAGGFWSSIFGK